MVYHYNYLIYVYLTINKTQEKNLAGNQPLKYGLVHLELKFTDIIQKIVDFLNNLSEQQ